MFNIHARVYFGKFTAQKMKIRLEPSNQTVPESNKNATQKIYKNEQYTVIGGCKPSCDADNGFPKYIVFRMRKSYMYCAKTIMFGNMFKTLARALPYGTDEPNYFVVSGVANWNVQFTALTFFLRPRDRFGRVLSKPTG